MTKIYRLSTFLLLILSSSLWAQDDLMNMLDEDQPKTIDYTTQTFMASRIINGQSIENTPKGALNFVISHHFGRVNEGWYEFWGLDQANIRFGFEYGITDWLAVAVGRTSVEKTYDGSIKVKLLRQSTGLRNMPLSVSYYGDIACISLKYENPERQSNFAGRLQYMNQLFIARKFGSRASFQLVPTYIHRNLVETTDEHNDIFSIGAGGRVKVSKRCAITGEYYYVMPGMTTDEFHNSFSFGVDLETGGHVFQLFLTNSLGLIGQQFIPETTGKWKDGDIHIGFNINRTFQIVKPKELK
jgi:hypothetical protein